LSGNSFDFRRLKPGQAFAKAGQAIPASLHGLGRQISIGIKPAALADRFFQVLGTEVLAVVHSTDFKAKAVRSQIDSRQTSSILHLLVFHF
jgi:hypothetical protein